MEAVERSAELILIGPANEHAELVIKVMIDTGVKLVVLVQAAAAAYLILAISAFASFASPAKALFGVGASALMLLFIGIRNSWDSASYHVLAKRPTGKKSS